MKVGIFFTWDYSLKSWEESGTLERELEVFRQLHVKKNLEFTFFTYGNKSELVFQKDYSFIDIVPLYTKLTYSENKYLRFIRSLLIPFKYSQELKSLDVIYQNQLLGCWVPIIIKFIKGKPLIIRTGYDMLDFAKKENKKRHIKIFYSILTRLCILTCDIFTLSSHTDLNRFNKKYPKFKNKLLLRQNWVKVPELLSIQEREQNRILAVGRLVEQKNFSYLLSEFSNTEDNLVIDIVGIGQQKEQLEELAKQNKVEVNFLGKLENHDLLNLYKNYKYYISTSYYEGNPKTLLEAMASGCIVLASNIDNHSEIITHLVNGALFELKRGELRKLFEKINHEKQKDVEISKNAAQTVKTNNSIDTLVDNTYNDIKKL